MLKTKFSLKSTCSSWNCNLVMFYQIVFEKAIQHWIIQNWSLNIYFGFEKLPANLVFSLRSKYFVFELLVTGQFWIKYILLIHFFMGKMRFLNNSLEFSGHKRTMIQCATKKTKRFYTFWTGTIWWNFDQCKWSERFKYRKKPSIIWSEN